MGNNGSQQSEPEQQWNHSFPRTPQKLNPQKVLPELGVGIHPKLRPTNNGEILYNGGTISGRHQHTMSLPTKDDKNVVHRSSSISSRHPDNYPENKEKRYSERSSDQSGSRTSNNMRNIRQKHIRQYPQQRELQMKHFGSVPDLRENKPNVTHSNKESAKDQFNKGRKKYKAPPPPGFSLMSNETSQDSWEMTSNGDTSDTPTRRTRLFKTKAEMQKQPNSLTHRRSTDRPLSSVDEKKPVSKLKITDTKNNESKKFPPPKGAPGYRMLLADMQRSKSLPEFQAELNAATQRLRVTNYREERETQIKQKSPVNNNSITHAPSNNTKISKPSSTKDVEGHKLKTLDCNISKKEQLKNKVRQMNSKGIKPKNVKTPAAEIKRIKKLEGSVQTLSTGKPTNERKKSDTKEQPAKTFYFGMENNPQTSTVNSNIVDNFASSFKTQNPVLQSHNYSDSDLSSEADIEDGQITANGIALHLRPILPKKQLEIPRFSPAAAWRLLSALESNPPSSTVSDEGLVFIEDRIEKSARQPPIINILHAGPRSNHDKSGDSGISGDAGPTAYDDNGDPVLNSGNGNAQICSSTYPPNISWTPQQDLEDEEDFSSDEDMNNNVSRIPTLKQNMPKFSVHSHVFSLSLPRDNHLATYMEEKAKFSSPPCYTNLQKLKRSVSGVLGNLNKMKDNQLNFSQIQNDNWFLSRSAPNSLNNGFNSLEVHLSKNANRKLSTDEDEEEINEDVAHLIPQTKNAGKNNCGRVMYLPQYEDKIKEVASNQVKNISMLYDNIVQQEIPKDGPKHSYKSSKSISKSCENIAVAAADRRSPFEPEDLQDPPQTEEFKWKGRKTKRFTFQSTVRQIERRRLSEKLSREAERKEQQRLSELEAMKRVEEEFQRKRAKEKASIRQQLRLFSLDDNAWNNSSDSWQNKKDIPIRPEPDGAASTPAPSPILDDTTDYIKNPVLTNDYHTKGYSSKLLSENSDVRDNQNIVKNSTTYHNSNSSDDGKIKAQATQVLSEYRQLQREYKEYRGTPRWDNGDTTNNSDVRQTTVHPKVICNMPRVHGHQGSSLENASHSTNYRRNFAHGVVASKSGSSTYSEDSQFNSRMHSPRITQSRRTQHGKCIS